MTWKHVALIICSLAFVLLCGISHTCQGDSGLSHTITTLATMVVAGALGHAGVSASKDKKDA